MSIFSIKDIEKLCGIKAPTLRIWEKRYGVIQPCRTTSNIRYYNEIELKRLLNISILLKNGFKISQVAKMTEAEIKEKVLILTEQTGKFDDNIEYLVMSTMNYDEKNFQYRLTSQILKTGLEETFIKLILPLLQRLTILTQTNTINHAQLKFAYCQIRQRLIVAIDSQHEENSNSNLLLFSFDSEKTEITSLFLQYILRKNGNNVTNIGNVNDINNFEKLLQQKSFEFLITSISLPFISEENQNFLNRLSQISDNKILVILSYPVCKEETNNLSENIKIIGQISDYPLLLSAIKNQNS
jgi:DNA-binding transcriptional MerR regulator